MAKDRKADRKAYHAAYYRRTKARRDLLARLRGNDKKQRSYRQRHRPALILAAALKVSVAEARCLLRGDLLGPVG